MAKVLVYKENNDVELGLLKPPALMDIDVNNLDVLHELVGGWVECFTLKYETRNTRRLLLVLDEEGKLKNKSITRFFFYPNGDFETLVGNLVAVAMEGENFDGLTEEEQEEVRRLLG